MNKLYYGGGYCNIEGDIISLTIIYRGAVTIKSLVPNSHFMIANERKIMILPHESPQQALNELFEYSGRFQIKKISGINMNGDKVQVLLEKQFHLVGLMQSKPTSMGVNTDELGDSYTHGNTTTRTTIDKTTIDNLHSDGEFYYSDGTAYSGAYHIHLQTSMAMTGGTHTDDSQVLYILTTSGDLIGMGEQQWHISN